MVAQTIIICLYMYMDGICIDIRLCVVIVVHGVPFVSSIYQWGDEQEEEDEEYEIEE